MAVDCVHILKLRVRDVELLRDLTGDLILGIYNRPLLSGRDPVYNTDRSPVSKSESRSGELGPVLWAAHTSGAGLQRL